MRDIKRRPLAEAAGIAPSTVGDIELSGQQVPTVGRIARLAAVLRVSAAWLGFGVGAPLAEQTAANCDGMGARLQAIRTQRGSKAELGRRAGLTAPSITQIENGGQSGVDVIESLAKALDVSPGWLAFGIGPQIVTSPRRGRPLPNRPPTPADSSPPAAPSPTRVPACHRAAAALRRQPNPNLAQRRSFLAKLQRRRSAALSPRPFFYQLRHLCRVPDAAAQGQLLFA